MFQPKRDSSEAAIAVFTAHKHVPAISTHQTTLQGVVYQLDAALQCPITQKAGIVFIYDMSNSKYSNFDYDLSQKILTLLKVRYFFSFLSLLFVDIFLVFRVAEIKNENCVYWCDNSDGFQPVCWFWLLKQWIWWKLMLKRDCWRVVGNLPGLFGIVNWAM